mmetsp:Transcript_37206/g.46895  ORF Transcript_37206/g.46895 Transcript_37206/m.46895 type:complete len:226 (-) Transcript_37206:42-719(-)
MDFRVRHWERQILSKGPSSRGCRVGISLISGRLLELEREREADRRARLPERLLGLRERLLLRELAADLDLERDLDSELMRVRLRLREREREPPPPRLRLRLGDVDIDRDPRERPRDLDREVERAFFSVSGFSVPSVFSSFKAFTICTRTREIRVSWSFSALYSSCADWRTWLVKAGPRDPGLATVSRDLPAVRRTGRGSLFCRSSRSKAKVAGSTAGCPSGSTAV